MSSPIIRCLSYVATAVTSKPTTTRLPLHPMELGQPLEVPLEDLYPLPLGKGAGPPMGLHVYTSYFTGVDLRASMANSPSTHPPQVLPTFPKRVHSRHW